jgi:RNA polymerase sigma-70 factor (ECF subfamily)
MPSIMPISEDPTVRRKSGRPRVSGARVPEGEESLLERVRSGDRAALDLLVEANRLPLWRFAMRLSGDSADADDLAQEALVRALRGLDRFRGDAAFRTWLLRIASNLWIERAGRADTRRRDHRSPEQVEPGRPAGLLEEIVEKERRAELRRAVAALPPRQRATVVLKVYQDLTFQQVAEAMDCPVGTAKANYHHALTRLRRELAEGGITRGGS